MEGLGILLNFNRLISFKFWSMQPISRLKEICWSCLDGRYLRPIGDDTPAARLFYFVKVLYFSEVFKLPMAPYENTL